MAAFDAFGTIWALHDGVSVAPAGFANIAEVTSVGVLDISVEEIETTAHDSVGGWKKFIGGLKDGGELSMEINYDPTMHNTLFLAIGKTRKNKITLPDTGAGLIEFDGFIKEMTAEAPYDDKLSASVTIKVTGAVVITP